MKALSHRRQDFPCPRRGAALIIALAMVVLVTIAILAFFSLTTLDNQIEASRSNRTKADLLADSGTAYTLGKVLAEITDSTHSTVTTTSGFSIYQPLAATNAYPIRYLAPGVSAGNASFFNLIRQSVPTADANASPNNTAEAANNGRTVDTNRWNEPRLLVGSGFTATNQIPNWIYLDPSSGVTATTSSAVIGRFAYNVYNVGGLLDANVAGYPSGVAAVANLMTYLKPNQGGADLTQLTNTVTQADVDSMATFRFPDNPATSTNSSTAATNYVGRILGASTNGFLSVKGYDQFLGTAFQQNMFASRQDLIRYATTQNSNLAVALPYLTHFSRTLNAPTYSPATPTTANPNIPNIRFAAAGTIDHYDDRGLKSIYAVTAGSPLMQRRFSLAKLAWLTSTGPATGISDAAIQSSFGLKWNATQERWEYIGPTGTAIQSTIKTLATVATETREPNFLEILKAGILSTTLGAATTDDDTNLNFVSMCPLGKKIFDSSQDFHVLQIAANIIDCADSDNYPTLLALQSGGTTIEKAGVEDLPYLYTVDMPIFMKAVSTAPDAGHAYYSWRFSTLEFAWIPELFALHQPSTSSTGPSAIQVNFAPGSILVQAGFCANTSFNVSESTAVLNKDLSVLPSIPVYSTNFENFRNGPQPVRDNTAANTLGTMMPSAIHASLSDVLAFRLASYANSSEFPAGPPMILNQNNISHLSFTQQKAVVMRLQYMSPGGQWKTYATLGGHEALSTSTGMEGVTRDDFGPASGTPAIKPTSSFNNIGFTSVTSANVGTTITINTNNACNLLPYDPRSSRFGPSTTHYFHTLAEVPGFTAPSSSGKPAGFTTKPFYPANYFGGATTNLPVPGILPEATAFQDSDGNIRPPDAALGYTTLNSKVNAANPYTNVTNSAGYPARPVILQRSYRSVAELGYVYRDMPWQTLNFFNSMSGNGGLLDVFSVRDEPTIIAGKVSMGTPHQVVLQALVSGTAQNSDGSLTNTTTETKTISAAMTSYAFSSTAGLPTNTYPVNAANLPTFMYSSGITNSSAALSVIKNRREAVVRALSSSTQTRTWNILVDLVAQTGRFPTSSLGSGDFVVEGESHRWISVAIDRYTGKIVDAQIEKVNE